MSARLANILPLLLITLVSICVVEGGYLGLEYYMSRIDDPTGQEEQNKEQVSAPEFPALRKAHDYRVILQRNLFGPPPEEKQEQEPPPADYPANLQPTELQIVLMGTVKGDDTADRAIILDKKNRKQQIYEVGDSIQGASIKDILHGKVIVAYNGRDEILDISGAAAMRKKIRPALPAKPHITGGNNLPRTTRTPGRPVVSADMAQVDDGNQGDGRPQRVVRRVIRPRVARPNQELAPE